VKHRSVEFRSLAKLFVLAAAAAAMAGPAGAGGLYTNEFATPADLNGGAGSVAWVSGASIALHNPAGMTKLDDHAFSGGLGPIWSQVHFDTSQNPRGGGDGGNQGGFAALATGSYVHRVSDRFRLGLSVFSLSGSALDPSNNWAGRFQVTDISLLTLSFVPAVGVRLTDWLSIGGGPLFSYGVLDWRLRGPLSVVNERNVHIDVNDWTESGYVGVLLSPTDDFDLGVTYLSETKFNLKGDIDIDSNLINSVNLKLDFPLPQTVKVGAYWRATDRLALLGTFDWEDWSTFNKLPVSIPAGSTKAKTGFHDTYKVGVGVHWRLDDSWLLQTGVAYDTSPVHNKNRTLALPVDQQVRASAGALYNLSEKTQLGFGLVYAWLGEGAVRTPGVRGDYDTNQFFLLNLTFSARKLPWSGMATF